ncbi:MAG: hypothetical protein ABEJ82_00705 [Haloplanus sp.]
MDSHSSRRQFLTGLGVSATLGVAGCLSTGGSGGDGTADRAVYVGAYSRI